MDATALDTTGSITIADLLPLSVELFADRVAQKHKVDSEVSSTPLLATPSFTCQAIVRLGSVLPLVGSPLEL